MEPGPSGQEDEQGDIDIDPNDDAAMEPGPSGQEDDYPIHLRPPLSGRAAMEPGPSGQEDPSLNGWAWFKCAPQWSLALQARKTRPSPCPPSRDSRRNGAWPFRPGRPHIRTDRPPARAPPQWSLALQARKTSCPGSGTHDWVEGRNGAWPFRPGRQPSVRARWTSTPAAAMEPGPSGQEDLEASPVLGLELQRRNGAWPFRPGRQHRGVQPVIEGRAAK